MKDHAVFVQDSHGDRKLLWFDDRQTMVAEYNSYLHLIAQDKGIVSVYAFSLCAGMTREQWVKEMEVEMLTGEEREIVAKAAEEYPPGWGTSFFCDRGILRCEEAAREIKNDPHCIQYG